MQRATYRSHESFDVMALFEDSLGSRLDGQVVLKLFQGHEKNLSQITGNQVDSIFLIYFFLNFCIGKMPNSSSFKLANQGDLHGSCQ